MTRGLLNIAGGGRSFAINFANYGRAILGAGNLIRENNNLKDKLALSLVASAELDATRQENDSLRKLLDVKKRSDLQLIAANVVGIDPSASTHALIIDRGDESGVMIGDGVVYGSGVMIGKVVAVGRGRATVLLTIDQKCVVAALVSGHTEANGIVSGNRGLVIKLGLVPHDAEFSVGDMVITSGGEPNIPIGLVLGLVDSVSRVPSDPFASATVIPAYDQNTLTVVAVIHKK